MRAITVPIAGGSDALTVQELADPVAGVGELLIEVAAAGVNRADIGQRRGNYPSPPGAPEWPGLEASGTVIGLGDGVEGWSIGDRACVLLAGGGYSSIVTARAAHALRVPSSMDLAEAAALPETLATVWSNVVMLAGLKHGETFLVHGGSSGIGTTAIQVAKALGATVAVTAGTQAKLDACRKLGADVLINYREEDFVARVLDASDGRGADVILDPVGGSYLDRDIRALAPHGRILFLANQSGEKGSLDIRRLMAKWASVHGTTLRARTNEDKDAIMREVREKAWPLVEQGLITAVVDSTFSFDNAAAAHDRMEASEHIGKILLTP